MPRPIEAVGTATAGFVGQAPGSPVNFPVKLSHFGDYEREFGPLAQDVPLGYAVRQFFDNGGKEAHVVRIDGDASTLIASESDRTGIYALDLVDVLNIVVLTGEEVDVTAQAAAIAYCERRRAFMIGDIPQAITTVSAAEAWIRSLPAALQSSNAAFYFPSVRAADPSMNGVVRAFPVAGAIAGLYARTDATRGVWKAPAGAEAKILGIDGLSVHVGDRGNAKLNSLGLNCLRTFPTQGTVCWGARTARGADNLADEFKYVPVRRLALFLEESISRGTQWVASKPNGEPLWTEIRESIAAFMHSLFKQGAFAGVKPDEAYFVKCDAATTSQNHIDDGRVNIEIGFAPLKRSEFIILRIQQLVGGTG